MTTDTVRAQVLGALAPHLPTELLSDALSIVQAMTTDTVRAAGSWCAGTPHLPGPSCSSDALTAGGLIETSANRVRALGALAPQLSGNLQQGFEALLDVLPRCGRALSLFAVSSFFPFLKERQGPQGLEEVRRAIVDTACWFP